MQNVFEGKKILFGITGSIAAYKSILIIRELIKRGADVTVVLTPSATNFVTPLTLANISRNQVITDMFDLNTQTKGAWHIHKVHECDLMIIAPCSASTLGKIANGICDNSLTTLAIALPNHIPLLIAPAMDSSMFLHPSTQRNIEILTEYGAVIIPPETGELSSGLVGEGRLPEPQIILDYIELYLYSNQNDLASLYKLKGKSVLITAGPTREPIDEVRFVSNYSSGKMGISLAKIASFFGANVKCICGPISIDKPNVFRTIEVESSDEMFEIVTTETKVHDIIIMASAVADFKPQYKHFGKLKKEIVGKKISIEFERTKDILSYLGHHKKDNQLLVGFALESKENGLENAKHKLTSKNCNLVILNYYDDEHSGFNKDVNTITILKVDNNQLSIKEFKTLTKNQCAVEILKEVCSLF